MSSENLCFDQLHIDVARNSTDDFNPFHDPQRWRKVDGNPFRSTIALGFQIEFLVADRVRSHRMANEEDLLATDNDLFFSNYEFRFANALHASEAFKVEIKNTIDKSSAGGGISNRVAVRSEQRNALVLIGTQSETSAPRFLADEAITDMRALREIPNGSALPGARYFFKRKFLNTSNGKNFALGSLCNQHDYFDELEERVHFAPLFTASLLSSALLEKGWSEGYDFETDPLVYTSHQISVDNRIQRQLRSNDMLNIVVEGPLSAPSSKGLGHSAVEQMLYRCFGVVERHEILFRANVQLAPLRSFLAQQ